MTPAQTRLEPVLDGLLATPPAPLPFGRDLVTRAFLVLRPQGNVVVYHAPGLQAAAADVAAHGGAVRQLINHRHEAMYAASGLDVPAYVHERDRAAFDGSFPIAGTFSGPETLDDDLQVVPTPGHTPGTTTFVWDHGGRRCLFTGDAVWVQDGRWEAVVLGDSLREAYLDSLATLRDLDADVLVPWGAQSGAPIADVAGEQRVRGEIAAVISRLEAGEDA